MGLCVVVDYMVFYNNNFGAIGMKNHIGDYSAFLEIKPALGEALEAAILKSMEALGEDIKGVSFFSSTADEYEGNAFDVAA